MKPPLSLAHALELLLKDAEALPARRAAIAGAHDRYAGADILASRTQPAADLSAMDGYAVREDDLAGPWRVVGESAAGHPYGGRMRRGEAVRISTGALVPADAGAVLLQENARRKGDGLALNGEGEPSPRHIRRKGFDFDAGDVLIPAGTRMGPAQIALAITGGCSEILVHDLPGVAVIDSGDELATGPSARAPHRIPASNGAMLAAMAAPFAASVSRIGPVPDRLDALLAALDEAANADVIVTSGGASVGDHDLVRPALEKWGAAIDFWRVAIKPGKPLLVARRGRQIVLGLPGNPASSFVTAFLFLLPLLRKLGGAGPAGVLPASFQASLTRPLPPTGERQEFVRARYDWTHTLTPLDEQDSSALNALAAANALIDRKPGSPAVDAGHLVSFYLLRNGGIA